jgi:BASS family bile acid:Na+ symporter
VKTLVNLGIFGVTVIMMVAVGMELQTTEFRETARRKGTLVLTLAAQAVALPLLGFALTHVMALPAHLRAGILLLAACPVGDVANFYALLARANVALSVTLNILSCLLSVVTMAAVFEAYDHLLGERFVFAVPTPSLILRLTLMVALPVLIGMGIRRFRPHWVERHARLVRNAGLGGLAFLMIYVMVTQQERLAADWQQTVLAGALFMALVLLVGWAFAWMLRLTPSDSATVSITFAVRNVALAAAIAITLINRIEYAVFATVYLLTEVPLLLGVAGIYRRWLVRIPQAALPGSESR